MLVNSPSLTDPMQGNTTHHLALTRKWTHWNRHCTESLENIPPHTWHRSHTHLPSVSSSRSYGTLPMRGVLGIRTNPPHLLLASCQ